MDENGKVNIALFISRFLYRIRYQMLLGSLVVMGLVGYFTQFLPKSYTVDTTIYTGIVSSTTVIDDEAIAKQNVSNTYDNLINLITSKTTLEKVSFHLLANNLIKGDLKKDNMSITAKHYKALLESTPDEVKRLVDKSSVDRTIENLKKYKKYSPTNYLYRLLNGNAAYYSLNTLSQVSVQRINNSDMIKISYSSDDPGITTQTVKYLSEELIKSYDELRYRATNDAIAYFQDQVNNYRNKLRGMEVGLSNYNIANNIINYEEQTKSTASSYTSYLDRREATQREIQSTDKLLRMLNKQMGIRSKIMLTNSNFLNKLQQISDAYVDQARVQVFADSKKQANSSLVKKYENKINKGQNDLLSISRDMDIYKYSKEGVAIEGFVAQWLDALIRNTRAKAEMKVLDERRAEYENEYRIFSPVGTEIKSREREINVTEKTYLQMVDALNTAMLRKRNIELTTAGLDVITEPSFPLGPNASKRMLLTLAAFFGSLIFILAFKLLVELLDRTLRDANRARRITGLKTVGVFSGRRELRFRGFSKSWNRRSAEYLCNRLNKFLRSNHSAIFNVVSMEPREGKSYVCRFLVDEWEKQGLIVKYIKAGQDFLTDASYLLASDFQQIYRSDDNQRPDILLIEYPSLLHTSVPPSFLTKADANILIANACRVWKTSDDEMMMHLNKMKERTPFVMCLNNSTREAVEDFTGNLPPYNAVSSFSSHMRYMGLTAKGAAVK